MYIILLLALFFETSSSAERKCPQIEVLEQFDINKFTGIWYQILRKPNIFERKTKCNRIIWTKNSDEFSAWIEAVDTDTDELMTREGGPDIPNPRYPSKMEIYYFTSPVAMDYEIIDVKYDEYAVAYSCQDFKGQKYENLWILGRQRSLNYGTIKKLESNLLEAGINGTNLEKIDQQHC